MRKSIVVGLGLLALSALPALASAQTGAWLHVRVEESRKPSKVHVNLPMSVVEAVLKSSPDLIEKHGKVNLGDHHGMKLEDLRRVWKQLAAVGDAEFVTVESEDETVKVQRKGDTLFVHVDAIKAEKTAEKPAAKPAQRRAEQVRVEIPVTLVDALLSGEGDQVNIQAAVSELQRRRGDIVRVYDGDSNVRIWIDEQNTQAAR